METENWDLKSLTDKVLIVDVDGTLAETGDRVKHIEKEPKDWDAFFEGCDTDKPIEDIIDLVRLLSNFMSVYFATGRPDTVREKTHKWLCDIFGGEIPMKRLLMRKGGDFRPDSEIKPELLEEAGIKLKDIAFILEDRNSMVKKWRELGVRCLQVDDADF
jgi:acid phosphatase class B